jgi:hypothetical protein
MYRFCSDSEREVSTYENKNGCPKRKKRHLYNCSLYHVYLIIILNVDFEIYAIINGIQMKQK